MPTDHELLGIARGATADEVKSAYRAKARQYHPDAAQDETGAAMFIEIVNAYNRLSDGEGLGAGDAADDDWQLRKWNPPPVRPTAQSHRPAAKRRPRVNDGKLSDAGDLSDVEFYLGPFQVQALQTGDLAIASRVHASGRERVETFVIPQGTADGSILQYAGFKRDRSSSANWFDARIRYHWSMVSSFVRQRGRKEG